MIHVASAPAHSVWDRRCNVISTNESSQIAANSWQMAESGGGLLTGVISCYCYHSLPVWSNNSQTGRSRWIITGPLQNVIQAVWILIQPGNDFFFFKHPRDVVGACCGLRRFPLRALALILAERRVQQESKRVFFLSAWLHTVSEAHEELITLHPHNVPVSVPDGDHYMPQIIIHSMHNPPLTHTPSFP